MDPTLLIRAVTQAFSGKEDFDRFLRDKLKVPLNRVVQVDQPYWNVIFELILVAERAGWLSELAEALYRKMRTDPGVSALLKESGLVRKASLETGESTSIESIAQIPRHLVQTLATEQRAKRQKRLQQEQLPDAEWIEQGKRIAGQICRIESGEVFGTGVLVGPATVLTCRQVVDWVIQNRSAPAAVGVRFDYIETSADSQPQKGRIVQLDKDWLIDVTPWSQAEAAGEPWRELPTLNQLDHALLRLAEPVGEESDRQGEQPRGWLNVPEDEPSISPKMDVLVAHYPGDRPFQIVYGAEGILGINHNHTRLKYVVSEFISLGAICFSRNWTPLALHNFYVREAVNTPEYWQAVPIRAIRDHESVRDMSRSVREAGGAFAGLKKSSTTEKL